MSTDQFLIRDYEQNDYPRVMELWQELNLASAKRGDNQQVIWKTLQFGGKLLLLVELKEQRLAGTSWLTVDGRRTYLHHFGIASEFQGRGLAKKLLRETLLVARQIGLQVKLEVERSNQTAHRLYLQTGFEPLGDYEVLILRNIDRLKL